MYSTAQRASLDVLHVQQNHKKQHRIQNSQRQPEAGAHAEQKPGTGNHQSIVTAMQTDESPQETLTHPPEAGGNQTSKTEAANAQPVDMDEERQPEAGSSTGTSEGAANVLPTAMYEEKTEPASEMAPAPQTSNDENSPEPAGGGCTAELKR